jgi:hypothetical protein
MTIGDWLPASSQKVYERRPECQNQYIGTLKVQTGLGESLVYSQQAGIAVLIGKLAVMFGTVPATVELDQIVAIPGIIIQ